ncbi:HGGxSTG domain-containing protein [Algiphilus sp.]|uniref:HGGxSTG domain-containing protein n=1 Tax=Algiphilus sp. TaxID=1872431 RepID=UPI0032F06088
MKDLVFTSSGKYIGPSGKPMCGAFARSTGRKCRMTALANGRCRLHGGASTGPKTPHGRLRSLANLRQFSGQASGAKSSSPTLIQCRITESS